MHFIFVFNGLIGLVFFILGIAVFCNRKNLHIVLEEISKNKGLLWLYGFVGLITGVLFISLSHSGLIMFIGWLAIIKGAFILIFPKSAASFYGKFNKPRLLALVGIIIIILGLILM